MKKILIITALTAFIFSVSLTNVTAELILGDWKIEGQHSIVFTCGGNDYYHTLTDGFPGSGTYDPNPNYTWDMTGDITGDSITFNILYTGINAGYTLNGVGTIGSDGSISGTTDGNCQAFLMLAGTATKVTPEDIMAVADAYVHGGGHALEENDELKRKDWYDVSFGGWIAKVGPDLVGEWQVNLHNVHNNNDDLLDKGKFHATEFTALNLFDGNSPTCNDAVNFTAFGTWNGKSGYKMIFRAGDKGSPNNVDTVRVTLYKPDATELYDTHWSDEFVDKSSCVGSARTSLDTGNITIYNP